MTLDVSPSLRVRLLRLARETVQARLAGGEAPAASSGGERFAAFVTWRRKSDGSLRGCIGHVEPQYPVERAVAHSALAAALEDPRFPPVTLEELGELSLDISLLEPPRSIAPGDVEPGRHGLIVSQRGRRGLLLPQVAPEQGWDREQLLAHTCLKAGLPEGAWREPDTELLSFTATVFGENETSPVNP